MRLAEGLRSRAGEGAVAPVCPELLGGLPCPRTPAERRGRRVIARDGTDVTRAYAEGSARSVEIAREAGARLAILKANSPSCGSGRIYDGTFSGVLADGWGITAALFRDAGIPVVDEDHLKDLPPIFR